MPIYPQIQALLAKAAGVPATHSLPVDVARAQYEARTASMAPPANIAGVFEQAIGGPGGPLRIRTYTPQGTGPFPLLVFFHGSGFVLCSLDTHDGMCRNLCAGAGCVVASIDYRLAPEHKFPAGSEDCLQARCTRSTSRFSAPTHRKRRVASSAPTRPCRIAWSRNCVFRGSARLPPAINCCRVFWPITTPASARNRTIPRTSIGPCQLATTLADVFAWREERTVSNSLTLQYDKVLFLLEPNEITRQLRRQRVTVVDYPDGRLAIRYRGLDLPYTTFDKLRQVSQGAIVENKHLGAALAFIREQQRQTPQQRSQKAPRRQG
jgi:alpha/beta hydrolase fold